MCKGMLGLKKTGCEKFLCLLDAKVAIDLLSHTFLGIISRRASFHQQPHLYFQQITAISISPFQVA
jgi:hypothetical protein